MVKTETRETNVTTNYQGCTGRTFLGWPIRKAVAVAVAAAAVGAAIGLALPTPDVAPCGYVAEDGVLVPASCTDADDLDATLAAIRETRTGGRFTEDARYAALNGADLDAEGRAAYLAEFDAVTAECGHLADQLDYERCEANYYAEVGR